MDQFFLLNSRKRAVIALIHAAVFLAIAAIGLRGGARLPLSLHTVGGAMLYTIYGIVTTLLLWLFSKARCWRERMYFGFCATSAGLSIVRGVFGDPALHPIQLLKVLMLVSGAAAAIGIYRYHNVTRPFLVTREPQLNEAD
ncbi:MAG TPA: hypothetical protein VMU24_04355 [Candidatus Acidoferrales bacterium]|nr:hypothetical protein [Candidatus Acidoferrales bacterium]